MMNTSKLATTKDWNLPEITYSLYNRSINKWMDQNNSWDDYFHPNILTCSWPYDFDIFIKRYRSGKGYRTGKENITHHPLTDTLIVRKVIHDCPNKTITDLDDEDYESMYKARSSCKLYGFSRFRSFEMYGNMVYCG